MRSLLLATFIALGAVAAPPTIFDVKATSTTATGATISWSLSEKGTGQVAYGLTPQYGTLSAPEKSFNFYNHVQVLSGLVPGTVYHFSVKSANSLGEAATSSDYSFRTLPDTPANPSVYLYTLETDGAPTQVNFFALPAGSLHTDFLWATSSGVATKPGAVGGSSTYGMITANGVYKPPSKTLLGQGVYKVWATSKSSPAVRNFCYVDVAQSVPSLVSAVSVDPEDVTVIAKTFQYFTSKVTGTGAFSGKVRWSATKGTITQAGKYTAPATPGEYRVTATSIQDPSKFFVCRVQVLTKITSITFEPAGVLDVKPGQSVKIRAIVK